MQPNELVERDGYLALYCYSGQDLETPTTYDCYAVSNLRIGGKYSYLRGLLGQRVSSLERNVGFIKVGYNGQIPVDTNGWTTAYDRHPIAPPRDGREYTHEWLCGKWTRQGFPKCYFCDKIHNPAFIWCDPCDKCKGQHRH
jgi:hypothetical protein